MCVRFRNGRLHASTIARSPRWRSDQIQVCSGSGRRIGMAAVPSSRIRACSRGSLAAPSAPATGGGVSSATQWSRTFSAFIPV